MKYDLLLSAIVGLSCLGGSVIAGEHAGRSIDRQLQCTLCATIPCCCPDSYCLKPIPCLPCLKLSVAADCYGRKPLPCIPCVTAKRCPDDYCRKPLPDLCCPVAGPCGQAASTSQTTRSPNRADAQRR